MENQMLTLLMLLFAALQAERACGDWPAVYTGPISTDSPAGITTDAYGNVYVIASSSNGTNNDYATIKFGPDGKQLWVARYDGPANGNDEPVSLCVDGNGNVFVTGKAHCALEADWDIVTIKYDGQGNEVWTARFDSPDNGSDIPSGIVLDSSGNVFVTGSCLYPDWTIDWVTLKYAGDGKSVWTNYLHGLSGLDSTPVSIALDASGYVYVCGNADFGDPQKTPAVATLKYHTDGTALWTNRFAGEEAMAMAVDAGGNAYVAEASHTLKYSPDGKLLWVRAYPGAGEQGHRAGCGGVPGPPRSRGP